MSDQQHTSTEVGHDAGHKGPFPPFDASFYPSQILWFALTFGVLFYVVTKKLGPALGEIVEGRRQRIARDFADAEAMKVKTEEAAAAYERELAEARRKAGVLVAETRAALTAEVEGRRASAESDLSRRLSDAEARIAEIKTRALAEVGSIATDTAEAVIAALAGEPANRDDVAAAIAAAKA
jgi:F-type H+-transporting ATPase subunit b